MAAAYELAVLVDEDDVPELNMEHGILDKLKVRIQLARQIDSAAHRANKKTHDKGWMRATAEAMELELGSDFECVATCSIPFNCEHS
jgi:ATP-dependent RNA helicase DDX24/MAK5